MEHLLCTLQHTVVRENLAIPTFFNPSPEQNTAKMIVVETHTPDEGSLGCETHRGVIANRHVLGKKTLLQCVLFSESVYFPCWIFRIFSVWFVN